MNLMCKAGFHKWQRGTCFHKSLDPALTLCVGSYSYWRRCTRCDKVYGWDSESVYGREWYKKYGHHIEWAGK